MNGNQTISSFPYIFSTQMVLLEECRTRTNPPPNTTGITRGHATSKRPGPELFRSFLSYFLRSEVKNSIKLSRTHRPICVKGIPGRSNAPDRFLPFTSSPPPLSTPSRSFCSEQSSRRLTLFDAFCRDIL
ncbi:hypothetical protein CEXT_198681 [Caerostris extrusa]|uniref:Uncharacterized protein n=1 Tax=Caerostris extrusa TaxID=172846 RepID=A0AAV4XB88_CAEEX|nr:hypothetical protein CEXT_198681 [Caerostris extrusa]